MSKALSFLGAGLVAVAACIATVAPVGSQGTTETVQGRPVFVDFVLPSDALLQLRDSLEKGVLDVIAQERGGKDLAVGKLTVIDNRINPIDGSIRFRAAFDNTNQVLQPGQIVNVRVLGYTEVGRVRP